MQTDQQRLYKLLTHPEWSAEDEQWMTRYIQQNDHAGWRDTLQELFKQDQDKKIDPAISERIRQQVLQRIQQEEAGIAAPVHRIHFLKTSWFRYAAAVILLIGGVAVWWEISQPSQQSPLPPFTRGMVAGVQPGTNRAILTIGNNAINLSNNKTGIAVNNAIAYNDGERIADGLLPLVKGGRGDLVQILQLTTPRGGQYQAVLPDGTKVWLNAASSIKFPSKFTSDKREVEVTGEAYLEVAKNTKQPFYVHTNKTTVQVLGTSFNVNAYEDEEAEKTTLIEGSVRVLSFRPKGEIPLNANRSKVMGSLAPLEMTEDKSVILKPGEQAILSSQSLRSTQIQVQDVIAWKSGYFEFNKIGIEPIMRQLARWYNLEVKYDSKLSDRLFVASISRNEPISKVLEVLEMTRAVHFKVEGNQVTVTN